MASDIPKTVLVIPVCTHVRTLREVVERCLAEGFPVLVVEVGRVDGGLDAIADLPVGQIRLPANRGKGGSVLAGAAWAEARGYEAVLMLDPAGDDHRADAGLIQEAAAADWPCIVIGERRMAEEAAPRSGLIGRDFSRFLVRVECGRFLPDHQSGFRLYPVRFLTTGRFLAKHHGFGVEVLVRGAWGGLPILSVPIQVRQPSADEKVSSFDILRLICLHGWLVTRSLLPWPHSRLVASPPGERMLQDLFHPIRFFRRLSREHTSAAELGMAVWVGIFIGALPIIPFGIASIIYVTHRLHLNKLAAVGASNVCCAPFVPFVCIEVGYLFRFGRFWTDFNRQTLLHEVHYRLWEWLLGALVVGPLLGTAGAVFTYFLVRLLRRKEAEARRPPYGEISRSDRSNL